MNKIVLVGAGQIGSRHLQALANIKNLCSITVVDPNPDSLDRARNRLLEVSNSSSNVFFTSEMPVGESFDLAIIATSADVRLAAFEWLLKQNNLKNVIFEKVLFQSAAQIQQCTELLEMHAIQAWVNCPRRAYPSYKQLKSLIKEDPLVSMVVTGSNYGLACNGIHFVDLFVYLSGPKAVVMKQELDHELFESKRRGCFEVFGSFNATTTDSILSVSCDNMTQHMSYKIELITKHTRYLIDELAQNMRVYNVDNELLSTTVFTVPPQSQLSHLLASEIILKNQCDLTTYSESALLHEQYLTVFFEHFNFLEPDRFDVCPIS
jgi:predicted dehydrogenase|tara:strand:- start:550 stop:1512 length:963 start_codon:yes stop_codon:yes gene_type:complete